jgi:hypothetical protein
MKKILLLQCSLVSGWIVYGSNDVKVAGMNALSKSTGLSYSLKKQASIFYFLFFPMDMDLNKLHASRSKKWSY